MTFSECSQRHPIESKPSWDRHRLMTTDHGDSTSNQDVEERMFHANRRRLHSEYSDRELVSTEAATLERQKEDEYWKDYRVKLEKDENHYKKKLRKQRKRIQEVYANPEFTLSSKTVHGLMIDAGSTGSRMHVYEWEPRVLRSAEDIQQAVSGVKLSFPGTESRWTDRLRPGLGSFASIEDDDELTEAISEYLQPLMDFAKAVLHSKHADFGQYPIFLRATAGMRTLRDDNRARIMNVVRSLFSNTTFNPFYFVNEQARVLSGEEEAIFDWAGVNFLLGDLLQDSLGSGTVIKPVRTHGALDLGGSSTQISFYEPNEDVMANLFKLQIGQAKHWNVYCHSFLYYGMNDAIERFQSRLAAEKSAEERLIKGIYNPCLPGGASLDIRTNIHLNSKGVETWDYFEKDYPSGDGYYQASLVNNNTRGDYDQCMNLTKELLHLNRNDFCSFSHNGDCSIDGTYQPKLPSNVDFVGFSNYFHVWQFLNLPERASIEQLVNGTKSVCSMSLTELKDYHYHSDGDDNDDIAGDTMSDDELASYCFRSVYALQLLQNGYGFQMNDTIRVIDVIEGQKVGWALGAMLYEINTMPWIYQQQPPQPPVNGVGTDLSSVSTTSTGGWNINADSQDQFEKGWIVPFILAFCIIGMFVSLLSLFVVRERRLRRFYNGYETVK